MVHCRGLNSTPWLVFPEQKESGHATIIYFHGNNGNVADVAWFAEELSEHKFNVLLFDYRGYGLSGGQAGAESGLYADGDAALAYVLGNKSAAPGKVVLYGQSLGTAIATDVASRHPCGALILESGFSSGSAVASYHLPWLPHWLHFLGRNRFESARKLKSVHAPVLITHGKPDTIIPTEEAQVLFAAAVGPKKLLIFPGAGHNVFGAAGDGYVRQLEEFIRASLKMNK
ncbi:MAG TPA: alpha/beta hydrolase [Pyrinomonadaceae bacterium]|nr:alpha/beta hydrolase [Pyrinomonadaceae bacterium]